jgi:hypothetical protein
MSATVIPLRRKAEMYATVIHEHNHPTRLLVAARKGSTIRQLRLNTMAPDYEGARREAAAIYPDRRIYVPKLGEMP